MKRDGLYVQRYQIHINQNHPDTFEGRSKSDIRRKKRRRSKSSHHSNNNIEPSIPVHRAPHQLLHRRRHRHRRTMQHRFREHRCPTTREEMRKQRMQCSAHSLGLWSRTTAGGKRLAGRHAGRGQSGRNKGLNDFQRRGLRVRRERDKNANRNVAE